MANKVHIAVGPIAVFANVSTIVRTEIDKNGRYKSAGFYRTLAEVDGLFIDPGVPIIPFNDLERVYLELKKYRKAKGKR